MIESMVIHAKDLAELNEVMDGRLGYRADNWYIHQLVAVDWNCSWAAVLHRTKPIVLKMGGE